MRQFVITADCFFLARCDERRGDNICAVVRWGLCNSISVQVLHGRELCSIFSRYLAEHIALPVLESAVLVEILDSLYFFVSKLKVEHVNIFADMLRIF